MERKPIKIPLVLNKLDVFAIDDYLRSVNDPVLRKTLIAEYGGSPEKIREFEQSKSLPEGAFELLLLQEDPEFAAFNGDVLKDYMSKLTNPDQRLRLKQQIKDMNIKMRPKFPRAYAFLQAYAKCVAEASERAPERPFNDNVQEDFPLPVALANVFVVVNALWLANLNVQANANLDYNANAASNWNWVYTYNYSYDG